MTAEFDHVEISGELDKGCFVGKVGMKPGYSGGVGRRGELKTASMNNSREKQKNEGKQRNKAMGREGESRAARVHPPCCIYVNRVLRNSTKQMWWYKAAARLETRYFNTRVTAELVRADEHAGDRTGWCRREVVTTGAGPGYAAFCVVEEKI